MAPARKRLVQRSLLLTAGACTFLAALGAYASTATSETALVAAALASGSLLLAFWPRAGGLIILGAGYAAPFVYAPLRGLVLALCALGIGGLALSALRRPRSRAVALAAAFAMLVGIAAGVWLASRHRAPPGDAGRNAASELSAGGLRLSIARAAPRSDRLLLTFENTGSVAIPLDVPHDDYYAPLLSPLISVEARDGRGRLLQTIQSFGCGGVHSYSKVDLHWLRPGEKVTRKLWLADRFYPPGTPLPRYSHLMLMNAKELKGKRSPQAVAGPITIRVTYRNAAVAASWRDDLISAGGRMLDTLGARWHVRAVSNAISYVDDHAASPDERMVDYGQLR